MPCFCHFLISAPSCGIRTNPATLGVLPALEAVPQSNSIYGPIRNHKESRWAGEQVSADHNDRANESNAHCALGEAYLWLGRLPRAGRHFEKCLQLCGECRDERLSSQASAGLGCIAAITGDLAGGRQRLERAAEALLQHCDSAVAARALYEAALAGMRAGAEGWPARMEGAAALLGRSLRMCRDLEDQLAGARARALAWAWRMRAREAAELRGRMRAGEALYDAQRQLGREALVEGAAALAALLAAGDVTLAAETRCRLAEAQMLGLHAPAQVVPITTVALANDVLLSCL